VAVCSAQLLGAPWRAAAAEPPAIPNSSEQRRALAKAKYERGAEAYSSERYADSVRLFLEADAISPSAALSFNIARAYERLADDAQTLRWYRNYLRLRPNAPNAPQVKGYVRTLSAALAQKGIQQVTVLSAPSGATVAIDDRPLGVTPLTVELSPGAHHALLSLRGFQDAPGEFALPAAAPLDLTVELKAAPEIPQLPGAALERGRRFGIAPFVVLGAAAACLGGALVFESSRRSAQNSARSESEQLAYERDVAAMNSRQTLARVFLGAGGVLAVSGSLLLVFNARLTPESRAVLYRVPGGAALSLERSF